MDRIKRIRSMLGRIFRIRPINTEARVTLIVAAAGTCLQFAIIAAIRGIPGISPNDLWLLLPSSFLMWVIANILRNVIDERRYGGLREGWKEIEVFWQPSDMAMLGVGDGYPREPVIVVSSPRSGFPEKGYLGSRCMLCISITAYEPSPSPGSLNTGKINGASWNIAVCSLCSANARWYGSPRPRTWWLILTPASLRRPIIGSGETQTRPLSFCPDLWAG